MDNTHSGSPEYGIAEVARLAGTTSRTLRHYDDVGLLRPTSMGANGYRYYDQSALVRLQRILMLRQLGLGLPAITDALQAADDEGSLSIHIEWLRAEAQRLDRQIASVQRTLDSIRKGELIMAENMLDGFDHTTHKEEVTQRWGEQAYAEADGWWRGLGAEGKQAFLDEHAAIAAEWARLAAAKVPPDGAQAQHLARRHRAWIAAGWGGRVPDSEQLAGLADMYVADERFARNYGGGQGAEYVRDALTHLALADVD